MKDKGIKFETLKKPKLIRNLVILFMITFIVSAIYFKTSSAKYQTTQVIPIINTKVINKPWWTLNITKDNVQTTIKSSGTIENSEYIFEDYEIPENYGIVSQTCTRKEGNKVENEIKITIENKKIKITDSAKKRGTVCEVYIGLLKDKILADNKLQEGEPDFSKTTCNNEIAIANTSNTNQVKCADEIQNGIYKAEDDYGETYYYRGSINNNWVKFGKNSEGQDIWWRIIRINGNGSIRLIYAGEGNSPSDVAPNYNDDVLKGYFMNENGINDTAYAFNQNCIDNACVGYMYGEVGVTTDETCDEKCAYQKTHANTNDSDAKKAIDTWYETNLLEEEQYLDGDAGFCGDRSLSNIYPIGWANTGYHNNYTVYGTAGRLTNSATENFYDDGTAKPIFKCPNAGNDLYTTAGNNKGNKALEHPIGMISADEIVYAGGLVLKNVIDFELYNSNYGYWLWNKLIIWTMSPLLGNQLGVLLYLINWDGHLNNNYVYSLYGLKPVINLKATTAFEPNGNGTIDNPYIVKITQ